MNGVAAQGDTWGIPGPAFAGFYLLAMVVVVAATIIIRRAIHGGRDAARELHPYEVAYLIGGGRRAVATAVAGLRADGAVETSGDGHLRAIAAPRTMRAALDLAVHETLVRGLVTTARTLVAGEKVQRAVEGIHDTLVRDGLVASPRQRAWSRLAVLLPALLFGLGIARLVAGAARGRPVGYLIVLLIALGITIFVLLAHSPRALRSASAAVQATRSRAAHLDPAMSPAWNTYGAAGAALAVALFGMGALTSIDPDFAGAAGLQGQFALAAGGLSGTSGGSSCGIGSSCGGGSGCGGGGCGGGGCGG